MNIYINQQYRIRDTETLVTAKALGGDYVCVQHHNGTLQLIERDRLTPAQVMPPPEWRPRTPVTSVKSALVDWNLATKIAWLEGLSVASECTGKRYCEVHFAGVKGGRIKYDPIGTARIMGGLITKYRVSVADNGLSVTIGRPLEGGRTCGYVSEHNGCFASTVLATILEAQV